MTTSRGILAPRTAWNDEQLASLRQLYPRFLTDDVALVVGHSVAQTYRKAHSMGLKKMAAFLSGEAARKMDRADHPARATRFQKGIVPWNKGIKGVVGVQPACCANQFTPGQQPHNTQLIGSTKYDKSGTLMQKISDAEGNNSRRWRGVHELVWVAENGPLPEKHIVVFRPGMRTNVLEEITLDRVECISLAENMQRNSIHNMPKELVSLVQLRGALNRQINKRSIAP